MIDLGGEYGAGLFLLAEERAKTREYAQELRQIEALFSAEPEYLEFLSCPAVLLEERLGSLRTAFAEKVSEDVLSFLLLLCEKGRIDYLPDALNEYFERFNRLENTVTAVVKSAVELDEEQKRRLLEQLERKTKARVNLLCEIDPAILGGLVISVDSKVIDASLSHRLHEVKDVMKA